MRCRSQVYSVTLFAKSKLSAAPQPADVATVLINNQATSHKAVDQVDDRKLMGYSEDYEQTQDTQGSKHGTKGHIPGSRSGQDDNHTAK